MADPTSKAPTAATKKKKNSSLARIRQVLAPERSSLAVALAALVVSSLGNFSLPAFVSFIIDRSVHPAAAAAGGRERRDTLLQRLCGDMSDERFLAVCAGVFATSGVASFLRTYLLGAVTARTARRLRKEAFAVILAHDMEFFDTDEGQPSELLTRMSGDIDALSSASSDIFSNFFRGLSSVVGGTVSMLALSRRLTLATFVLAPPLAAAASMGFRRSAKKAQADLAAAVSATNQKALDMVSNVATVKLYTNEPHERAEFARAVDATAAAASKAARAQGMMMGSISFLGSATLLGVMFYGGRQLRQGLASIMSTLSKVRQTSEASKNLFALLESGAAATERQRHDETAAGDEDSEPLKGDIVFENVGFHYAARPDVPVLEDFNLRIAAGKTTALVGPSGGGKTTAAALLTQLYSPCAGRITWGVRDIAAMPRRAVRRAIAVVQQNPVLFDGTIADNILYGDLNATGEDMRRAAEQANIHEFIEGLPEGYDTPVGTGGAKLSAGQRQRVVIARAILKDPRLLILDEATASLDRENEAAVEEALQRLRAGRTVLHIAHRGLAIENADVVHDITAQTRASAEQGGE